MIRTMARGGKALAWGVVLALAALLLAALGYEARDSDSRLYAEIGARMAETPMSRWIAPLFPPGWYMSGLFREHPVGIHLVPALLARLGYASLQAAYLANAFYQVLSLVVLQRLAATVAGGLEARALGWVVQLLPIAFTYRIRANHEPAVLLCLLVALYGLEEAGRGGFLRLAVPAGLVGLLLVKGVLVVMGFVACVLWILARARSKPGRSWVPAAITLVAAGFAVAAAAFAYEYAYRHATGEPFWSVYLSRQLGIAAADQSTAGVLHKAYNLVWYLGRVLWFPFPWSLTLGAALATYGVRGTPEADPRGRSGIVFVLALTACYLAAFSLSDRRADRYIFPVYYAVGAAGAALAMSSASRFRAIAMRLDRVWLPPAVWLLGFGLHLAGGGLGLPTVKLWAPDS